MDTRNIILGIILIAILFMVALQWRNDEPGDFIRDAADETSDAIKEGTDEVKDAVN